MPSLGNDIFQRRMIVGDDAHYDGVAAVDVEVGLAALAHWAGAAVPGPASSDGPASEVCVIVQQEKLGASRCRDKVSWN